MYVEVPNVITYSIRAPADLGSGMSLMEPYAFLDDCVVRALQALGLDTSYEPINVLLEPLQREGCLSRRCNL